jgi:hypothetical protein
MNDCLPRHKAQRDGVFASLPRRDSCDTEPGRFRHGVTDTSTRDELGFCDIAIGTG